MAENNEGKIVQLPQNVQTEDALQENSSVNTHSHGHVHHEGCCHGHNHNHSEGHTCCGHHHHVKDDA